MLTRTSNYKFVNDEFLLKHIFGNNLQNRKLKFNKTEKESVEVFFDHYQIDVYNFGLIVELEILNDCMDQVVAMIYCKDLKNTKFIYDHCSPSNQKTINIIFTQSLVTNRFQLINPVQFSNTSDKSLLFANIGFLEKICVTNKSLNYCFVNEKYYIEKKNMIIRSQSIRG